jgi:TfoX/Sxy family transcriptional regulator of competence genes
MSDQPGVEAHFGALAEALVGKDGVKLGSGRRGFGSDALQVDGRIFAMVTRGRIVLKLPRERVSSLIAAGIGSPFDAGKGRPMREWVMLEEDAHERLLPLAQEARAFVSGRGAPAPRP